MLGAWVVYRRQLLYKCQEEFEKGAVAMQAVEARAKAEQGNTQQQQQEQHQAQASLALPGLTPLPCAYVQSTVAHLVPWQIMLCQSHAALFPLALNLLPYGHYMHDGCFSHSTKPLNMAATSFQL